MHLPEVYKTTDVEKINLFIQDNSFADLVTIDNGLIVSNKVPFYFDEEKNVLYGHFGITNSQLNDIKMASDVLVIFSGANTYVSPRWYKTPNSVPTWNFQTLQIRGKASILDDAGLIEMLEKLSEFHEKGLKDPWSMHSLDSEIEQKLLKMIVGFKIEIQDINFKEKMSQNRNNADQTSIIEALEKISQPGSSVATIMKENLKTK